MLSRELPSLKDMVSAGDPCLLRDSRSACSSSRSTTITLSRRNPAPTVRKNSSHFRILHLSRGSNLRCRAQKRGQALRVKVNFPLGFGRFPGQVWIWQKKNSVAEDAPLALISQRKSMVPTTAGSTVLWRMLAPPLARLHLLCLDVSVHVVLVTLDVSLARTFPHVVDALSTHQKHLKGSPVWCLPSQSFECTSRTRSREADPKPRRSPRNPGR